MKILTACRGGNNRSVVLATILKTERNYNDVLNYGIEKVSKETEEMLCEWADKILVTTKEIDVPEKYRDKRVFIDVGFDRWGICHSVELQNLFRTKLNSLNL